MPSTRLLVKIHNNLAGWGFLQTSNDCNQTLADQGPNWTSVNEESSTMPSPKPSNKIRILGRYSYLILSDFTKKVLKRTKIRQKCWKNINQPLGAQATKIWQNTQQSDNWTLLKLSNFGHITLIFKFQFKYVGLYHRWLPVEEYADKFINSEM